MGLAVILIGILVAGVVFGPQLWVSATMRRHNGHRTDFPGTGGDMARHLVERFGLTDVRVEATDKGDHYDPQTRTVRLGKANHDGRSLTAVAVAAHEIGHAIQHHRAERGLTLRQKLVGLAMVTDRFAAVFFVGAPILFAIARSPAAIFGMVAIGIGLLAIRVLVHLVTLPVEYDASFNKALPILREGGYLDDSDMAAARSVLRAAALTYVSAALMSLLDLARWVRLIR